jgi:cytoskeleton protein RodZ
MSDFSMTEPMHDAADQPEQQSAQLSQPLPGAQLAARRQQFGWTIEQVASQINLAPRQIEAIEADNYAALPGMAVARGFIRAYAKLLKLDAAPLMAQIGATPSAAETAIPLRRTIAATSFTPHRPATRARRTGSGKLIVGVVAIALIGAGAYVALHNGLGAALAQRLSSHLPGAGKTAGGEAPAGAAQVSVADATAAPAASEAAPAAADATASTLAQSQSPTQASTQEPTAPAPLAPAVAQAAAPAALTPSTSLEQVPATAGKALVLKLREDSWVEIRLANNHTLVSKVMRAGTTESFPIDGPATLVVGNARGVDATLRGEPLNLRSGAAAKNNVARVRVQ